MRRRPFRPHPLFAGSAAQGAACSPPSAKEREIGLKLEAIRSAIRLL
ncbi:MAG TPA: hypothetical protein VGM81_03190 [Burkholderiaceae bacterium]